MDTFREKLAFLLEALDSLKGVHFTVIIPLIQEGRLTDSLLRLLQSGSSRTRLKAFTIVKKI